MSDWPLGKEWRNEIIHTYDAIGQLQKPPFQTKCLLFFFRNVSQQDSNQPPHRIDVWHIMYLHVPLKSTQNVGRYTSQIGSQEIPKDVTKKLRSWRAFHRSRMVSWMLGEVWLTQVWLSPKFRWLSLLRGLDLFQGRPWELCRMILELGGIQWWHQLQMFFIFMNRFFSWGKWSNLAGGFFYETKSTCFGCITHWSCCGG